MLEEHTRSLELVPQLTRRKAPCQARSFAKEIPFIDLFSPAKAGMTAASEREHTPAPYYFHPRKIGFLHRPFPRRVHFVKPREAVSRRLGLQGLAGFIRLLGTF